jgi:chromosomal replication initiation ATPase DnaA
MMSPEEIITEVALVSGIPAPAITGRRRTVPIARARFLAIAAVRSAYSDWSLQAVGALFRRDHGAIMNARDRHCQLLKTDPNYQALARQVCRQIFYGPATSR